MFNLYAEGVYSLGIIHILARNNRRFYTGHLPIVAGPINRGEGGKNIIVANSRKKRSNNRRDASPPHLQQLKGTGPLYTHYTTIGYLTCLPRQKTRKSEPEATETFTTVTKLQYLYFCFFPPPSTLGRVNICRLSQETDIRTSLFF